MGYKCIHYDEDKCKKLSDATVMVYCHEGPCGDETFPEAEWIPVTERVPGFNEDVIAHYQSGKIRIAYRLYTTNGFDMEAHYGEVTHWMPLPAPPVMDQFREVTKMVDGAGDTCE